MSLSGRRVRAIVRKELREYRRNRSLIWSMAIFPLIFCIQPFISVFLLPASASGELAHEHVLLYLLGIPALVPVFIAAYAVVGERQQGTLEPVLTTPIPREEFLLGKALAALLPSLGVAYAVFAALPRLYRTPRAAGHRVGRDPGARSRRPGAVHAAACCLVDLGRYRRLRPVERHPGRATAQRPREPAGGLRGGAHRAEHHSADARPRGRACDRPARARWTRLADHLAPVRSGAPRHRDQVRDARASVGQARACLL